MSNQPANPARPVVGATYREISTGHEFTIVSARMHGKSVLSRRIDDQTVDLRDRVPAETVLAEYEYVRCNHESDCCKFHGTHAMPHRSCIMR